MRYLVLLKLLNEFRKRGFTSILALPIEFNKFNNTWVRMLIYHMTLNLIPVLHANVSILSLCTQWCYMYGRQSITLLHVISARTPQVFKALNNTQTRRHVIYGVTYNI